MVNRKKKNKRMVSTDDIKLFRDTIGSVIPLEFEEEVIGLQKPRPDPLQSKADEYAVLQQLQDEPFSIAEVETGDELSYLRPGIQKNILKKLKRGQIAIQAELDLHGLFVKEAKPMVNEFITGCINKRIHAVRIIHGKGRGSRDKYPVLKNNLNKWLQLNQAVLAFCSARPVDGGTGAVYVLFKRKN